MTETNLLRFRAAVAGALAHLESRRQEVNDLNVFPVADGDTGDNMVLTLRAVLAELDRLQGDDERRTVDEIGREEIVQSVARAALLGARGNSGVILSQLIRGAAEELGRRSGELVDATVIAAALDRAAERAYDSVRSPAEGTILTVAREMAQRIASDVEREPDAALLAPDTPPEAQDRAIATALERAVDAGQESVKRGPELLAALRDAGVVDAGGYGLTILFAGVVAALRGDEPPALDHYEPARIHHPEHTSSTYRYCTNFAVTGEQLDPEQFLLPLEALGDSVLVVGDEATLKVHVHTDTPELAAAVFDGAGEVSHLDVADMHVQVAERQGRLAESPRVERESLRAGQDGPPAADLAASGAFTADGAHPAGRPAPVARCGAVAVVSGDGINGLFRELGVHTLDGGPTLNPSTYELLAAIHGVPAEEVIVLPGSPNVVMAAERAAELSDKEVLVVPATSQQAGLAAALALAPDQPLERNGAAVREALAGLRTGAVAPAARPDPGGRFAPGDAVGFLGEDVIAWGEPTETLRAVLEALADGAELLSILTGAEPPISDDAVSAIVDGQVELELRHGGQSAYWWLLAAE